MRNGFLIGGIVVILLCVCIQYFVLDEYALAYVNDAGTKWVLVKGWGMYSRGLVFFIPAIIIALLACIPMVARLYRAAENIDHTRQIESMAEDVRFYQRLAETAESKAQASVQAQMAEAKAQMAQAKAKLAEAESAYNNAVSLEENAISIREKATQAALRAGKKQANASAAFQRLKRREAALRRGQVGASVDSGKIG